MTLAVVVSVVAPPVASSAQTPPDAYLDARLRIQGGESGFDVDLSFRAVVLDPSCEEWAKRGETERGADAYSDAVQPVLNLPAADSGTVVDGVEFELRGYINRYAGPGTYGKDQVVSVLLQVTDGNKSGGWPTENNTIDSEAVINADGSGSWKFSGPGGPLYGGDTGGTVEKLSVSVTWSCTDNDESGKDGKTAGDDATALCPSTVTSGALEPTQGVWQHDPVIPDTPGKQLTRVTPVSHTAELPMVKNRPTLIFGYPSHELVEIRGTTTGTAPTIVRVRVKASGAGAKMKETLKASITSVGLTLAPPCGDAHEFIVYAAVPKGVPKRPDQAFTFEKTGQYKITAKVEAERILVEPAIEVTGEVVETRSKTVIVPLTFRAASEGAEKGSPTGQLVENANEFARAASKYIPDMYPLEVFDVKVDDVYYAWDDLRKNRKSLTGVTDFLYKWLLYNFDVGKKVLEQDAQKADRDFLTAELQRRIADKAPNVDRIIAILPESNYKVLAPDYSGGITLDGKVVFVPDNLGLQSPQGKVGSREVATVIAHELAHTMPYLWSSDQMVAECGLDYHNKGIKTPTFDDGVPKLATRHVANGVRITDGGFEDRTLIDGLPSFMSSIEVPATRNWIDQCTYRNLVQQLKR